MPSEPSLPDDRCKCHHIRFRHQWQGADGRCSHTGCACEKYERPTIVDVELPEPEEPPLTPDEEEEQDCPCMAGYDGLECPCTTGCGCCPVTAAAPPQPERRPPYAVAYSVAGHLYEAYVPGDATVCAIDGVLIIEHSGSAISGITQVLPVRQEK